MPKKKKSIISDWNVYMYPKNHNHLLKESAKISELFSVPILIDVVLESSVFCYWL